MPPRFFHFPTIGVSAASRATLLAIDDYSLPLKENLCYYLSKPTVRADAVLAPRRGDPRAPDSIAGQFYGTVLHDGGRFRLWYYSISLKADGKDLQLGPTCYAESADGLHWERPDLGQVLIGGSKNNNALAFPEATTLGPNLLRDEDDPDPQRRYKLIYNYWDQPTNFAGMRAASSPDGLHWRSGAPAIVAGYSENASFLKHQGLYIVHSQMYHQKGEGGLPRERQGYAAVSPDFDHWVEAYAETFALRDRRQPTDPPAGLPLDQVHLGVGAASFGNVAVGLYCIWHQRPVFWDISGDLGLVVSHDGIHFREPVKGHIFLAKEDSPAPAVSGRSYPTILCQSNGILNVGDETRIYHGRWRNAPYGRGLAAGEATGYYGEIALAALPRDRWGALGLFPDQTEGSVWSAPVALPAGGCQLTLNADAASALRVEMADERFTLLPQYSGGASGTANAAGGFDCPVTWQDSLAALGGQTVRFRIHLQKQGEATPRLYALYLS